MDMNNVTSVASEPVVSKPADHDDDRLQESSTGSQKRTQSLSGREARAKNRTNGNYACKVQGCPRNAFGCQEDLNIHHFGVHTGLTKVDGL
jgi:hypothetical protein